MKLTEKAAKYALEIIGEQQDPKSKGLRIGVQGGGCSGFSYSLGFEKADASENDMDKTFEFFGLKVFVDQASFLYLENVKLDYIDDISEGIGFKFSNPDVKSTCGCGSSFNV